MAVSRIPYNNPNELGTGVNISSYTSANPYVTPSDGYVVANCGASTSAKAVGIIVSETGTMTFGGWNNGTYMIMPVFVKKGMRVYKFTTENNGKIEFYPLTN